MDRAIYIAANAAKNTMTRQDNVAANLANVNTPGFRAQLMAFRSAPVTGDGLPTRAFAVESTTGADFTAGPLQATGRDMDVAVQGSGWLAVETAPGKEAYTREGSLQLDAAGVLVNQKGRPVLGETGPLTIPPDHRVSIEGDGTVTAIPVNGQLNNAIQIGKLKLVNPDEKTLVRGDDTYFRTQSGLPAPADPQVKIASGMIESSNVNPVEAMVQMISAARQFDMQMKMISTVEANGRSANQLFSTQ
ncbi:MAG: flagellar basal-body rod protein FlgF [Burkholderiaceae bacterium]|jgi:flagellar basal-body rod protein FlgF